VSSQHSPAQYISS